MSNVQVQTAVPLKEVRALCRAKYGVDWWKHPDKDKRKKEARAELSTSYLPAPTSTPPIDVLLAKIASLESKVKEQAAIIEEDSIPNGAAGDVEETGEPKHKIKVVECTPAGAADLELDP